MDTAMACMHSLSHVIHNLFLQLSDYHQLCTREASLVSLELSVSNCNYTYINSACIYGCVLCVVTVD